MSLDICFPVLPIAGVRQCTTQKNHVRYFQFSSISYSYMYTDYKNCYQILNWIKTHLSDFYSFFYISNSYTQLNFNCFLSFLSFFIFYLIFNIFMSCIYKFVYVFVCIVSSHAQATKASMTYHVYFHVFPSF